VYLCCVCVCMCVYVCKDVFVYVCVCIYVCVCVYLCVCMYVYVCVDVFVYVCVCTYCVIPPISLLTRFASENVSHSINSHDIFQRILLFFLHRYDIVVITSDLCRVFIARMDDSAGWLTLLIMRMIVPFLM